MKLPISSRELDYSLLMEEFQAALLDGDWEACLDRESLMRDMWMFDVLQSGRLTPELQTLGYRITSLAKRDIIK